MERNKMTADQAFDALRRGSQQLNRRLRDIAEHIAATGEVPVSSTKMRT
jgi:AmiR/NasT family two-component response regulator